MRRPVIGICTSLERAQFGAWNEIAALLPRSYIVAVQKAAGWRCCWPRRATAVRPDEVLDLLDGLVLAGGVDVDPSMYGPSRTRDDRHRPGARLVRDRACQARDGARPAGAGICRGMQVMNVALGGT